MPKILITGSAGFIGFHVVTEFLFDESFQIFGLDSLTIIMILSLNIKDWIIMELTPEICKMEKL